MTREIQFLAVLVSSFALINCGGKTDSGVFKASSYCASSSCIGADSPGTSIAFESINPKLKYNALSITIEGICNPGTAKYTEVRFDIGAGVPTTLSRFGWADPVHCESGRFSFVVTRGENTDLASLINGINGPLIASKGYTLKAQLFYGDSSVSTLTAGPSITTPITFCPLWPPLVASSADFSCYSGSPVSPDLFSNL